MTDEPVVASGEGSPADGAAAPAPGGAAARAAAQDDFDALVDAYLRYLGSVRRLSPNTQRAYAADLGSYVRWTRLEGVLPLEVTHRQLRGYLGDLSRAGYSPRTVNRHLSALRGLYRWLVHEGVTPKDAPAALASPKMASSLPRALTDAEVRRLLGTCDDTPAGVRDRAFLELLYASGARVSEASALDVGDLDLRGASVRLLGKGSKERVVPLYPAAVGWLRRYLDVARPALARPSRPTRALFLSSRGRRMSADALRGAFERHVDMAGLDAGTTPHAMRHAFATELLSGGADLRSVQELLGHESLATTQIYTHLSVGRLKAAARQAHPRSLS